jgi:hypothetical protein
VASDEGCESLRRATTQPELTLIGATRLAPRTGLRTRHGLEFSHPTSTPAPHFIRPFSRLRTVARQTASASVGGDVFSKHLGRPKPVRLCTNLGTSSVQKCKRAFPLISSRSCVPVNLVAAASWRLLSRPIARMKMTRPANEETGTEEAYLQCPATKPLVLKRRKTRPVCP